MRSGPRVCQQHRFTREAKLAAKVCRTCRGTFSLPPHTATLKVLHRENGAKWPPSS